MPTWYHRPGGLLSVDGRTQLTAQTNSIGEDYERGQPEIDPPHHRIFVGSSDRGLYSIGVEDMLPIWRFQTAGVVQSEPLYDPAEDVVYFGSNDGALYKVRAADGEMLWRFATNAEVSRRPILSKGVLYFVNANDTILSIDAATGKSRWMHHRTPAYGMEIAGHAGVALHGSRVFTSFSDGRVFAFDTGDGKERWAVDLGSETESTSGDTPRYLDADATPVPANVDGGAVVFVASYAGGVQALDTETGARVWGNDQAKGVTDLTLWEERAHLPKDGGPAIPARRLLLASSGTTGLWALDVNDGHELWRKPLPEGGVSAPMAMAGAILVSTTRYGLFLMSPLDGSVIDGLETGSGFAMTPMAHGRRAFVMSNQGVLFRLHVDPPNAGIR
jgi:outer membrane protein assembly factor BamB